MNEDIERESNLALIELDRGVRAASKGDQVECVVSFSEVFEKHPFPIFVNSACLKLADCFNTSNNFVRMCIAQVFDESQKHLDKLNNVDEFVRRITQVIHSNDPVARAVTLRCFAACSSILSKEKLVHHSIVESLSSHDLIEVQAAIYAVERFVKVSSTFQATVLPVLSKAVETGSQDLKREIIPILEHINGDEQLATQSRELLLKIIKTNDSSSVVVSAVNTLTSLVSSSKLHHNDQINLLTDLLSTEDRVSITLTSIKCIGKILQVDSNFLSTKLVDLVLENAVQTSRLSVPCLAMLCNVTTLDNIMCGYQQSKIKEKVEVLIHSVDIEIAVLSLKLVCILEKFSSAANGLLSWCNEMIDEHLCYIVSRSSVHEHLHYFKTCIESITLISDNKAEYLYTLIIPHLTSTSSTDDKKLLVCEYLMTLEHTLPHNVYKSYLLPALLSLQTHINEKLLLMLCCVIFKQVSGCQTDLSGENELLSEILSNYDGWVVYRVIRASLRFSKPDVALNLLPTIKCQLSQDGHYYFYECLYYISKSFKTILQDYRQNQELPTLNVAVSYLSTATQYTAMLKHGDKKFSFQLMYTTLRYNILRAQFELLSSLKVYYTSPPPTFKVETTDKRWSLQCDGPIATLLSDNITALQNLESDLRQLEIKLLDADLNTRQHVCSLREEVTESRLMVEMVYNGRVLNNPDKYDQKPTKLFKSFINSLTDDKSENIDLLCEFTIKLITSSHLHMLPRYFFQQLQTTSVTLNVTSTHSSIETVYNHNQTEFNVRVEGVLSQTRVRHTPLVNVARVHVKLVGVTESSKKNDAQMAKSNQQSEICLEQTCELVNDFYSTEFPIVFSETGNHFVKITCLMEDEYHHQLWDIGCMEEIQLKSYKDRKFTTSKLPL